MTFGVDSVLPELRVPPNKLESYSDMNLSKKHVKSETLRKYYNKFNIKNKFIEIGFDVPELYLYSKFETDLENFTRDFQSFVAKPVHMSLGDFVWISGIKNKLSLNQINQCLFSSAQIEESDMLKECDRGIIVEKKIQTKFEMKVFVVFGEPIIADIRLGSSEFSNIDYIFLDNKYLNWSKEYDLISKLAKDLSIDFFRIDFLYDGLKLFASECAFMPSTILPKKIEDFIYSKFSKPYHAYYWGELLV